MMNLFLPQRKLKSHGNQRALCVHCYKTKITFLVIFSIILSSSTPSFAKAPNIEEPFFSTRPLYKPEKPRGIILTPTLSFLFPGFGQWREGRYKQAGVFTGSAVGGLALASKAQSNLQERNVNTEEGFDSRDNDVRNFVLGNQIYMAAGSFSAFTSFRAAVKTRQGIGQYAFLPDETVEDILWAPIEFKYLKRSTTYIPLLLAAGIITAGISSNNTTNTSGKPFSVADFGYANAFSFLAGTNEEALFRGYIMPAYMNSWQSPFWSNTVTSLFFSLAHVSSENPVPWPQFLLGWQLGYIVQQDNWSLAEATFLHTWWDVIVFTGMYIMDSKEGREAWIRTPLIQATF